MKRAFDMHKTVRPGDIPGTLVVTVAAGCQKCAYAFMAQKEIAGGIIRQLRAMAWCAFTASRAVIEHGLTKHPKPIRVGDEVEHQ
jgi:hypothetical protein